MLSRRRPTDFFTKHKFTWVSNVINIITDLRTVSVMAKFLLQNWQNKVAVVTGASSGIGAALTKDLVNAGLTVVGLARREDRMRQIRSELPEDLQSRMHPIRCDVSNEETVKKSFDWVEKNLGGTDILINNAGIIKSGFDLVSPNNTEAMKELMDVNVMGVLYCVREAYQSMKNRNFDGHIIVVNSILGYKVLNFMDKEGFTSLNMYCPSKFAVTAMIETYRQEFSNDKTKIKISSISPGLVDTELVPDVVKQMKFPTLNPRDVADAILYVLATSPNVQVHEVLVKPIGEQF